MIIIDEEFMNNKMIEKKNSKKICENFKKIQYRITLNVVLSITFIRISHFNFTTTFHDV